MACTTRPRPAAAKWSGVEAGVQGSVAPRLNSAAVFARLRKHAQTVLTGGTTISNKQADLFVYPQDNGPARLVYRVSYFVDDPTHPTRPTAIIDANTGEVINSWNGLTDASANGPGGNLKTGKYIYGTNYAALNVTQSGSTCTLQNTDVSTYNMNHATTGSGTLVSVATPSCWLWNSTNLSMGTSDRPSP